MRSLKRLVKSNCKKTTVELTAMFDSESKSISTRTMQRELKGLGLNSCVALRKPLISEANRKKRLQFAREHKDWTLEQWKKVMWSDESKFTLFQSYGRIRVRREADKVMHPSCLVPTIQACGGSAMIWGCCSRSGLGSAKFVPKEWGQLTTRIYWITRLFHQWIFSSLIARAYSKMTMPGFIGLKLWKSGLSGKSGLATTESRP